MAGEFEEFVGAISMDINGTEVDVVSLSVTETTGVEPVVAMTREARIRGYSEGVTTYAIEVTVLIPKSGDPIDWASIRGATITSEPVTGGNRETYTGCCTTKVGREFKVQGQAQLSLSMFAQDKLVGV